MIPTPSTSHVSFNNVYEPAEDSFLLLDTLSSDSEVAFLKHRFSPTEPSGANTTCPLILEVGTGSGVILAFVAAHANTLLGTSNVLALGIDINEFACKATSETVESALRPALSHGNGSATGLSSEATLLDCINADLVSVIRPHSIDILIFNPPYVPSETIPTPPSRHESSKHSTWERNMNILALATDGGADGMEVTKKLLDQLPTVLNETRGVAYVLLCAQNQPDKVKQEIRNWSPAWSVETVRQSGKRGGWERLQIIKIMRNGV